jgi:DNA invertase Pin-like site-specific DNA recombinase
VICSLQSMPKGIRREQSNRNAQKTGYVAYYRVSTDKQGESGLGLEAQREAVRRVAQTAPVLAEFTEVETAKKSSASNRPQLLAAIEEAKKRTATLLIAKLDRLARNVYFISGLMESGVDFIAADMPQANRLTVHIMAAFAEHEARAISDRTTAALAALRGRGVKLGNPRWAESIGKAREARIRQMAKVPPPVIEMIQRLRLEGGTLRAIAGKLNALGLRTPRGGRWHASRVKAALAGAATCEKILHV